MPSQLLSWALAPLEAQPQKCGCPLQAWERGCDTSKHKASQSPQAARLSDVKGPGYYLQRHAVGKQLHTAVVQLAPLLQSKARPHLEQHNCKGAPEEQGH